MKPQNSAVEKELSQLHQAQSALDTATNLFEHSDYTKALDFIDKVVLVFSPACSQVLTHKFQHFHFIFILQNNIHISGQNTEGQAIISRQGLFRGNFGIRIHAQRRRG